MSLANSNAVTDYNDVLERAAEWRASGKGVALATVVTTWGSSPRPIGSQLAEAFEVVDRAKFVDMGQQRPRSERFGLVSIIT